MYVLVWGEYPHFPIPSVSKAISQINIRELTLVLFKCDIEAVQEVFGVGFGEHGGVVEGGAVGSGVGVVFDCFNDVAQTLFLQLLLRQDSMHIVTVFGNIT